MTDDISPQTSSEIGHVQKLASQSAALLSTGVLSYVGGFGLQLFLARTLGFEEFGIWVVAFSFVEVLSVVGLMGGDWLLLRYGSYYQGVGDLRRLRATIRLALLLSGVTLVGLGTVLFVLAPIAEDVFDNQSIGPALRLAAVVGPIVGIRQILLFGTQAFKSVRDAALIRNVALPAVRFACVSLVVLQSRTAVSALLGLLAAEILLALASGHLLNRRVELLGPTAALERRSLIKFAGSAWGTRVVEGVRYQTLTLLLGGLASVSSSGLLAASRRITLAPGLITSAMNQVYSPIGSELYLKGKREDLAVLAKNMARWIFLLAFPFFCLLVMFPQDVLSLFGPPFREASSALVVLAIGMLFLIATGPVTTTLIVIGRPHLAFADSLGALAAEVGLSLWLIPSYGITGAAIALAFGRLVNNIVPLFQVWRVAGFHPYRVDFWKPTAAGVLAAAIAKIIVAASGLSPGVLAGALAAVIIGGVYVALLTAFGLSAEDRTALKRFVERIRRVGKGPRVPPETTG